MNDASIPLPALPTDAKISDKEISKLVETAERLCGVDGSKVKVVREGLCFRPVTPWGQPIISRLEGKQCGGIEGNVVVAVGHGPWGISLSLGTGKVVSEMVRKVETSCRVDGLGVK